MRGESWSMDIVARNFFRLLSAGAFGKQDMVEPMSAYKWQKVMHLSILHGVEAETYQGLEVLDNQFAVQQVSVALRKKWAALLSTSTERRGGENPLTARFDTLASNKRLSEHLDSLAKRCDVASPEYQLLEKMFCLAYALLTDDRWVVRMIDLGEQIRERSTAQVNQVQLKKWIGKYGLKHMALLEGALLTDLAGFMPEELPTGFLHVSQKSPLLSSRLHALVEKLASAVPQGQQQIRFSQEGNEIFVHTSNANALAKNVRRSARFLPYYPVESISQLFSSFATSLTNIEE